MYRLLLFTLGVFLSIHSSSQVKNEYLYNTSMPYGVLDIRTKISATNYYYLQEDKTFSFRESAPGVRTNTYHDMTAWDTSPYRQGNLRRKNENADQFIMNYRLLYPGNYDANFAQGYPLILLFHGAKERANCFYEDCYHGDFTYDPNVNSPPAPTTSNHPLLNNDHHLFIGAQQHMVARDAASGKYPNDPSLAPRAFPGFVLMPQMMNIWDSLNVQDVIRIVQLVAEKYNIDEDRIYIEGLSIGGYAVYEALKRAPWLFAAAIPMSAVTEAANIFYHQQQGKVFHVPIWAFQGGVDTAPSPAFTESILKKFRDAGGTPRYTLYPQNGHVVWTKALGEPDYYQWLLGKKKNNLHASFGITEINQETNVTPVLVFAEGFLAYQWQKDGVTITTATSNRLTVVQPGVYRARFSRISSTPAETQWSGWSAPVTITQAASSGGGEDPGGEDPGGEDPGGEDPGGEDPGGEDPGGEDPGGEDPGGEDPGGEDPGGEDPGGEDPGGEDPGGEDPGGEDPGGEEPPNYTPPVDTTDIITGAIDNGSMQVELYPNPVSGESFVIKLSRPPTRNVSIVIVDMLGRQVYKQAADPQSLLVIEMSPRLPVGLYCLMMNYEGKIYQKNLVIR
jgi:dienelactone hydrolase